MKASAGSWCKFRGANLHLQKKATAEYVCGMRRGLIERKPCVVCGDRAEGHHEDYALPLDVIWLCRWHHAQRHQGHSLDEMHRFEAERLNKKSPPRDLPVVTGTGSNRKGA